MRPLDALHLGPQKSGTTWVYACLGEHDGVALPPKDSIHYFDMFWARGRDWLAAQFADARPDQLLLDPTPSLLRSPVAPERVLAENPDAKLIVNLRDPIDRAFSHFWHEKKKKRFDFSFDEVLSNYDLFANWLEPGFYATHLERWLAFFPRDQLLCLRFERIADDPDGYLRELLEFLDLDADGFAPSCLRRKVNAAGPRRDPVHRGLDKVGRALRRVTGQDAGGGAASGTATALLSGKREYDRGVEPTLRAELIALCAPEIERLERLLDVELDSWRDPRRDA